MKRSRLVVVQEKLIAYYERLVDKLAGDTVVQESDIEYVGLLLAIRSTQKLAASHQAANIKAAIIRPCLQSTLDCVQADTDRCVLILGPEHLEAIYDAMTKHCDEDDPFRVMIQAFWLKMLRKGFS